MTALWLLLAVLLVIALLGWTGRRGRAERGGVADSRDRRRHDSTLGELRDLREALRPVQKDRRAQPTSEHSSSHEPGD
jgi:hypothetical protein